MVYYIKPHKNIRNSATFCQLNQHVGLNNPAKLFLIRFRDYLIYVPIALTPHSHSSLLLTQQTGEYLLQGDKYLSKQVIAHSIHSL